MIFQVRKKENIEDLNDLFIVIIYCVFAVQTFTPLTIFLITIVKKIRRKCASAKVEPSTQGDISSCENISPIEKSLPSKTLKSSII
jgi:hypothetical protein